MFRLQARDPQLEKVLEANKEVFEEGLGTLQGTEAKIYVDPSDQPKFVKARPVPYALKAKIELELDRLEHEGIISPMEFSEWAAPIVPVVKLNGTVRICGDYKCTANQVSKLDNYPIPKTEDLLATLGGGNTFTKLDMSQAYQQLPLDNDSKKFTTINTHKGLYQYNRLPFGVFGSWYISTNHGELASRYSTRGGAPRRYFGQREERFGPSEKLGESATKTLFSESQAKKGEMSLHGVGSGVLWLCDQRKWSQTDVR